MWTSADNGRDIGFWEAFRLGNALALGGYNDWRLPTVQEAISLVNTDSYPTAEQNYPVFMTELIKLTRCCIWVSYWDLEKAGYFDYVHRVFGLTEVNYATNSRALFVRGASPTNSGVYLTPRQEDLAGGDSLGAPMAIRPGSKDIPKSAEAAPTDDTLYRDVQDVIDGRAKIGLQPLRASDLRDEAAFQQQQRPDPSKLSPEERENWQYWQQERDDQYAEARRYEEDPSKTLEQRKARWLALMKEVKRVDNPLTEQDNEYFDQAVRRISQLDRKIRAAQMPARGGVRPDTGKLLEETDRFLVYSAGVVVDKETNLMWAQSDNGHDIGFREAGAAAIRSTLAGFNDWRLPTIEEAKRLFNPMDGYVIPVKRYKVFVPRVIRLTRATIWVDYFDGDDAGYFDFSYGKFGMCHPIRKDDSRLLLVRGTHQTFTASR